MRFSGSRLNLALLFLLASPAFAGNPPARIVTLIPSLAEVAVDILGGDEKIVGVSEYTDFPKSLSKKPSIGTYSKPNLETIISLKPDLVLASSDGSPPDVLDRLAKLGVKVLSVGTESIEKVRASYAILGGALDRKESAMRALSRFDHEMREISDRSKIRKNHPRVLLQVGDQPLIVAGGKSFLNEALGLIGAENIYRESSRAYPRASVEDILKKDPEVILLVSLGNDLKPFERAKKYWEGYPTLSATKTSRIVILRSDALVRPGPRFPSGLRDLENALFGKS